MEVNKKVEYNSKGQLVTITIQTDWDSKEVIELPPRCSACPAGYSCSGDCGRNVPLQDEDYRYSPKTCKLKKLNLLEVLKEYLRVNTVATKREKSYVIGWSHRHKSKIYGEAMMYAPSQVAAMKAFRKRKTYADCEIDYVVELYH